MPIRSRDEYMNEIRSDRRFEALPAEVPVDVSDRPMGTFGAAFEESFIGRSMTSAADNLYWNSRPTENYDAYDDIVNDDLGAYAGDLIESRSREEYDFRKQRINRSLENKQALAEGGVKGVASQLAWGLVDPVNFVPVAGAMTKTWNATRSLTKVGMTAAAIGGVSQAAQEGVMSQIDPTYDPKVGMTNIAANTILSGVLGPGLMALATPEIRANFGRTMRMSDDVDVEKNVGSVFGPGSGGAAAVKKQLTLDELEVSNAGGTFKAFKFLNRNNRGQASMSETVRNINANLNETALIIQGNKAGIASPVPLETVKNLYKPVMSEIRKRTGQIYFDYRKSITGSEGVGIMNDIRDATGMTQRAGLLTQTDFNRRVSQAMRRGDKDIEQNPFVEKAAAEHRQFFNMIKDKATELGIWKEEPDISETAESYFSRVYDHSQISAQPEALTEGIFQFYRQQRDEAAASITTVESEIKAARSARNILRTAIGKELTTANREYREAGKRLAKIDGRIKAHEKEMARRETAYRQLQKRMADAQPMDQGTAEQWARDLYKEIKGADLTKKLKQHRLLDIIRQEGGIAPDREGAGVSFFGPSSSGSDNRSDIRNIMDDQAKTIFRKGGKDLDHMREVLTERGFLPEDSDVNDLLALIEQDAKGIPVYDPAVLTDVLEIEARADYIAALDEQMSETLGINISDLKSAKELEYYMAQIETPESSDVFKYSTPGSRGRYREMTFQERRHIDAIKATDADLTRLQQQMLEVSDEIKELRAARPALTDNIKEGKKVLNRKARDIEGKVKELESLRWRAMSIDEELFDTARTTVNRILKSPYGLVSYEDMADSMPSSFASKAGFRGSLKQRKLKIPDVFAWEHNGQKHTFEDFLVNSPDQIMQAQMRTVVPDMLIMERFGMAPDQFVQDATNKITADYNKLITNAKTPKKKQALQAQLKEDLKDIQDSVDGLRGTLGQPDDYFAKGPTAVRTLKSLNYLRLLGGQTVSSFADVGSIVLSEGLGRTFGGALKSFTAGLRGSKLKAAKEELVQFITASEVVMNSRYIQLTDFDTFAPAGSKFERGSQYATNLFQHATLMPYWLDGLRSINGLLAQDRLVDWVLKQTSGKISNYEKTRLANNFIDANTAKTIAQQFEKHGEIIDGIRVPNLRAWDTEQPNVSQAMTKMRAAVLKDIDTTIVMPGSDKPTISSNWFAGLAFQFKSFAFAATHRVLMKSGQRLAMGDMQVLTGISSMVGLGMLSYWAKAQLGGYELSDDPKAWIAEGIDRSGVLGIVADINNMTERATGNNWGIRPALGVAPATRYINRNFLETIGGPTAGLVQDVGELAGPISSADVVQSDIKKIRRMLPFQNALGIRYLFDGMEAGVGKAFNVPQKRGE